jgi:transposase InsO family protein
MCGLLGVARSSFYAWRNRTETPTAARRRRLAVEVRRVFDASRQTSGCRRIAAQLNRDGHECSVGLVADLMRELGLRAVQPRGYKRTTIPGEDPVESPDLIGRDFDPARGMPGERLVGDITYLKTGEGWLYLATVIDLATRMVVGWQLATHMRTSLVVEALQMAIHARLVRPDAIFHSDRGTPRRIQLAVATPWSGGERWVCWNGRRGCGPTAVRSDLVADRRSRGGRIGFGSGGRLLVGPRPRTRVSRRACQGRSGFAGSVTLAA